MSRAKSTTPAKKSAAEREDAVWRALSDRTRRALLDELASEAKTTGALVDAFPHLSRTAVMKHLDVLEDAALITVRRDGRMRWNQLNTAPIQEIADRWVDPLIRPQAKRLNRLKRHVEGSVATPDKETNKPKKSPRGKKREGGER